MGEFRLTFFLSMKQGKLLFFLICLMFIKMYGQNESVFIKDKSLRVDFLFSGNFLNDTIVKVTYWNCPQMSQNINSSIDLFEYGSHKIEVYDSTTNKLIFSKGFCSLFEEWINTPQSKIKTETFEMSLYVPMPKNSAKIIISNRKKNGSFVVKHQSYFSNKILNQKQTPKFSSIPILSSGNSEKSFDLVIVPDGYSKQEEQKMRNDFKKLASYLINCEPYSLLKNKINITGILVFSDESGINDPSSNIKVKTAVNSSFNALESDRYLMIKEVWKLNDIAQNSPFDAILVMCNTSKYGGGGIYNLYATTCIDCEDVAFVMTHELGHSISGLADEYYTSEVSVEDYYPLNIEPWEPNITTLVNFEKKWKDLIKKGIPIPTPVDKFRNEVGVFEGGGYQAKGVFRPVNSCSMKDIDYNKFCPVCQRSIKAMIEFYCK